MRSHNRVGLILIAATAGIALAVLGLVLTPALSPAPELAANTPPPGPTSVIVAVVGAETISLAEWRRAAALDQALSALAGQPAPDAEATLDQLINARVVLQAAAAEQFTFQAGPAEAEARLAALEQGWGINDQELVQRLAQAPTGLTRADLVTQLTSLLRVEAYLQRVAATQDAQAWLAGRRAQTRISILAELAASTIPVSQASAPTPTPPPTPAAEASLPEGVLEGERALDFELAAITGERVRLSALRGGPVVVNFWATWCPACQQELPALQAAYAAYAPRGVTVLGVDLREEAGAITAFASPFGLTFPLLLDQDGAVAGQYRVLGIPTTVFIDAAGVIRARHVGPLTEARFAEYVDPLLTAAPAAQLPSPTTAPAARPAPAFSLPRENGAPVALADYQDKQSVVLVFYRGQT